MSARGSSSGGGGNDVSKGTPNPPARPQAFIKRHEATFAGAISSVLSTSIAFPLDSIKTRMQTYKYAGLADCIVRTYQTEKLRGFFRGVTAPLCTITMVRTISVSLFDKSKLHYSEMIKRNFGFDVIGHVSKKGTYPNLWTIGCFSAAGATAGAAISFIACPFELTKLSAQVSVLLSEKKHCPDEKSHAVAATYRDKGTFRTMANIVKHRGFAGLYTGLTMHILRDSIGTGIYFGTYETVKQTMTTVGNNSSLAVVVSGGLCGIVSWAMIYPIDSAKSIYQRNALMYSKGEVVKAVKIEFFKRHMYRGLGVSMGRSALINAVFFSSYEKLKKEIQALKD